MMLEYTFYKLFFQTGVHLGNGILNSTEVTFRADTLFSALFIEAIKMGCEDTFLEAVKNGEIVFSDAFPFDHDEYYIPKPMLHIKSDRTGSSIEKKFYKNLHYLPVRKLSDFLLGKMELIDRTREFIKISTRTMARVQKDEDTLPFQVGVCSFESGTGLYIVVGTEGSENAMLFGDLMEALAAAGIGGKRSAGFGKFTVRIGSPEDALLDRLGMSNDTKMLLSTALPKEEEMETALEGASYSMVPRTGFVASAEYPEDQKKHSLFAFDAGSCFKNTFSGDIYNVSRGSSHPVYRYAKPVFMGIMGDER